MIGVAALVKLRGDRRIARRHHPPVHLLIAAVALGCARAGGASWDELRLGAGSVRRGLRYGGPLGVAVAAVAAGGARRDHFRDHGAAAHAEVPGSVTFEALVRIPLNTGVYEEVLFRSTFSALARTIWSPPVATAISCGLFGLWHLPDVLASSERSPSTSPVAAVVGTAAAGLALEALAAATDSVVAPMIVHSAANAGGLLGATYGLDGWSSHAPAPT